MSRRISSLLVLVMVFMAAAFQLTLAAQNAIVGRVVGVHDGDTVTILTPTKTEMKIRLEGIDAPELKQPFGQKSKSELSAIVFGKEVEIAVLGTDRYKRTLGRITCGEINVNLEMVKRGMAWRYEKYSKDPSLLKAQEAAKAESLGLWAGEDAVAPWDWRAKKVRKPNPPRQSALHRTALNYANLLSAPKEPNEFREFRVSHFGISDTIPA